MLKKIIKSGEADLVSFGRKFVNSPTWLIKDLINHKKKKLIYQINIKGALNEESTIKRGLPGVE